MSDSITRISSVMANDIESNFPFGIASDEDRSAPRQRFRIPSRMRFSCSSSFPVEVTDMSLTGFTCDALREVHSGTLCWLTLPGLGALEAEVVRRGNAGISCSFKSLLNPAVLNHYVAKYSAG